MVSKEDIGVSINLDIGVPSNPTWDGSTVRILLHARQNTRYPEDSTRRDLLAYIKDEIKEEWADEDSDCLAPDEDSDCRRQWGPGLKIETSLDISQFSNRLDFHIAIPEIKDKDEVAESYPRIKDKDELAELLQKVFEGKHGKKRPFETDGVCQTILGVQFYRFAGSIICVSSRLPKSVAALLQRALSFILERDEVPLLPVDDVAGLGELVVDRFGKITLIENLPEKFRIPERRDLALSQDDHSTARLHFLDELPSALLARLYGFAPERVVAHLATCKHFRTSLRHADRVGVTIRNPFGDRNIWQISSAQGTQTLDEKMNFFTGSMLLRLCDPSGRQLTKGLQLSEQTLVRIEALDLTSSKIGRMGPSAIMCLQDLPCVQSLQLFDNELGDAGAKALKDALGKCKRLCSLGAGGNRIGDQGAEQLALLVRERTGSAGKSNVNHCLKELDMQDNRITDVGFLTLAEAAHSAGSLEELNLSYNSIIFKDMSNLVLPRSLRSICFKGNIVRDVSESLHGLRCLATAMLGCNHLTLIDLQNTLDQLSFLGGTDALAPCTRARYRGKDAVQSFERVVGTLEHMQTRTLEANVKKALQKADWAHLALHAEGIARCIENLPDSSARAVRNPESKHALRWEIESFLSDLPTERPPRIVLIFYAGHAVQEGNQIFLDREWCWPLYNSMGGRLNMQARGCGEIGRWCWLLCVKMWVYFSIQARG